jgi:hypothetical protein
MVMFFDGYKVHDLFGGEGDQGHFQSAVSSQQSAVSSQQSAVSGQQLRGGPAPPAVKAAGSIQSLGSGAFFCVSWMPACRRQVDLAAFFAVENGGKQDTKKGLSFYSPDYE